MLRLSWILKADQRLFGETDTGVLEFVCRYAPADVGAFIEEHQAEMTIEYFQHDWSLNDVALGDANVRSERTTKPRSEFGLR